MAAMAWRPSWISFQNDFSFFFFFWICKTSWYFQTNFKSIVLSVQQLKGKIDFQDGSWISNWNNFSCFFSFFLSTSCTNISYKVLSQLAFQFWRWRAKQIFNGNDFSYFWSTSCPNTSKVASQLAIWFRRRSAKYSFKMAAMVVI